MPRRPRIHYPGAVYHVIARGVEKRPIFLDSEDRERFLRFQSQAIDTFGASLIAFCLMPNHVHMAVRVRSAPLSRPMHKILFRHAVTFNEKYGRVGHLFQGRHSAYLVTNEAYLGNLIRYIHQNPVRAKLVARPRDWRWSSCTDDQREEETIPEDFDPFFGETPEEDTPLLMRLPISANPTLDELGALTAEASGINPTELRSRIKRPKIMAAKRSFSLQAAGKGFTTADISKWLGLTERAVARYIENVPNVRAWP